MKLEQLRIKEFSGTYVVVCRGESGLLELKNLYLAQASLIRSIYQSPVRLTRVLAPVTCFERLNPIVQNAAKQILYQVEIEKKTRSHFGHA